MSLSPNRFHSRVECHVFSPPLARQEEKLEESCEAFMQAADLYSGEEVSSTANNCKLKVAQLSAQLERYPLAIEVYEEAGVGEGGDIV